MSKHHSKYNDSFNMLFRFIKKNKYFPNILQNYSNNFRIYSEIIIIISENLAEKAL